MRLADCFHPQVSCMRIEKRNMDIAQCRYSPLASSSLEEQVIFPVEEMCPLFKYHAKKNNVFGVMDFSGYFSD